MVTITVLVVFLLSFLSILAFIYISNKKEPEEEKMGLWMVLIVSLLLAIAPTVAIAIILFVILGSANVIDMLFSLQLSTNQLIIMAISILIYLFTIDSVIEVVVKYMVGKSKLYVAIILLSRIFVFYWLGLIMKINQTNSFIISIGVASIILLLELLYQYRKK